MIKLLIIIFLLWPTAYLGFQNNQPNSISDWVNKFYSEPIYEKRLILTEELLSGEKPTFTDMFKALEKGKTFSNNSKTGRIKRSRKAANSYRYRYIIDIPNGYDSNKKYGMVFFLHGGITRKKWSSAENWWPTVPELENQHIIKIYPASWHKSKWWHDSQVINLVNILDEVKTEYNIDSNKIFIAGLSDGGSGIYYIISRLADYFGAAAPIIGSPSVVANKENGVFNETYPVNLSNIPWLIINGERDRLYSPKHIEPYIKYLEFMGVELELVMAKTAHSIKPLKQNADRIYQFFKNNPRQAHPSELIWEVDQDSKFRRNHGLIINKISNTQRKELFQGFLEKRINKAMVKLKTTENIIELTTKSVTKLTLLISPQKFNLELPVKIILNGKTVFEQLVKPRLNVLLKWAAKDIDTHRLYVEEIAINLED